MRGTQAAVWILRAFDTGDAILADVVLRENGARKQDERPFMGATVLANLKNVEHIQARALLNRIVDLNQEAGLAYSQFMRRDSASFQRIQLGLKARRGINLIFYTMSAEVIHFRRVAVLKTAW